MVILYLSDKKIQIAVGNLGMKAQVYKCYETDEIAECMLNGNIVKRDEFCEIVNRVFEENKIPGKKISLVLNSNQIITKAIKSPAKDVKRTFKFISNEFSNVERTKEPVYGYMTLREDKKTKLNKVLAMVADKTYLEDFVETFKQCGITIKSVETSLTSAVRVTSKINGIKNKTSIVEFKEKDGVFSILFVDGDYAYSTYTKMNSEDGSEEYIEEFSNSIYNIIQFTQNGQVKGDIQSIMLSGFNEESKSAAKEAIASISNEISVGTLKASSFINFKDNSVEFSNFVYPAGGLVEDKKTVNLLNNIKNSGKEQKSSGGIKKLILFAVAIFIVVAIGCATVMGIKGSKDATLKEIKAYNNAPKNIQIVTEYNKLISKRSDTVKRQNAIGEYKKRIKTYPLPNTKVNKKIEKCASGLCSVETMSYNSITGEFTISALASKAHDVHKFIRALEKIKTLKVQEYSGYEYIEEKKQWSVNVIIILKSKAGK